MILTFLISCNNPKKINSQKYELYAIKYGESKFISKNIFYNDKENKYYDFSWLFYLIKISDKIILIDTGFSDKYLADQFNIKLTDPIYLLKKLKIEPENVTDIILTHSHFDHIGNINKFINANIFIEKNELDYFFKYSDLKPIKEFLKNNKKIITFDKLITLYNIINIKKIGGHTIGSSIVELNFKEKHYMIIGDECYLNENINLKIPVGTFFNHEKNKNFINNLDNNKKNIYLTFHEPSILINSNIKKIIP